MRFHLPFHKKTADDYFEIAWDYSKSRDYKKEELAYHKCLELDPTYKYANNNLGRNLFKQKRYSDALTYLDKSIALGTDGHNPYRNKFDVLRKLGQNDDAITITQKYPKYFKTKYYQNAIQQLIEISKVSVNGVNVDDKHVANNLSDKINIDEKNTMADIDVFDSFPQTTEIDKKLNEATSSDYAGKINVVNEKSGITLYQHQKDAIKKMDAAFLNDNPYAGLLVLPTGGGKTLTATYWLMANILDKGCKVVWLAHRDELLNQALHSFRRVCYQDITHNKSSYNWRIISGKHDKPIHIKSTDDIIITSKASLKSGWHYFLKNWLDENNDKVFLVIDEAHHATAQGYREIISGIKDKAHNFQMLGLTATPFRTADNEQGLLKKIFTDDIIYKLDLRELINQGILAEPIFKSISTNINMLDLFKENHKEETLERIANDNFFDIESIGKETASAIADNSKRNSTIVEEYVKHKDSYGQTIVFALNVTMAVILDGLFKNAGIASAVVVSDIQDAATRINLAKENPENIRKFRNHELDILVNVNILTEGTDLPHVQSIFLTRPTKSTILMTQMIGRALRGERAGGTKNAYIVSFIDDWQDKIAWVNPETLYINKNVDFSHKDYETQKMAMRLISIAKMEEFAKIANDTVDSHLSDMKFIDRIPVGIYKFSYLIEDTKNKDYDYDKNCNILVYDCMTDAYEKLFAWLPTVNLSNIESAANHVDATLFGNKESRLGYTKNDIIDIINYYKQTQDIPEMIYLSERKDYDITVLAQHIEDNDLTASARKEYINTEWDRNDNHWSAFFGITNQKVFRKLIDDAVDRIENPDDYTQPEAEPIIEKEITQYKNLSLYEIDCQDPSLGKNIRNAVYKKYTDKDGFYYSAQSGYKSRNPLDFQIDHIKPMAHGGLTTLDNLQLLTYSENMSKSDKLITVQ